MKLLMDKKTAHGCLPEMALVADGFSLVEVIVSLCLIALAFAGVLATYTTSISLQKDMDERAKIMFRTQKVMEETANISYDDLTAGITMDYIMDEDIRGYLFITTHITDVEDTQMEVLWTRYADPSPLAAYKQITVEATWGNPYVGTVNWNKLELNWLRVKRENSVEFSERTSSQQ
jgi:Tfp pilus assembly protein PilV